MHIVVDFIVKLIFNVLKIVKLRRLGVAAAKAKQTLLDEESGSYNKAQFIQEGFADPTGTHYTFFLYKNLVYKNIKFRFAKNHNI